MTPYPEKTWNSFCLEVPPFSHGDSGLQISLPMTSLCVFAVKWRFFFNSLTGCLEWRYYLRHPVLIFPSHFFSFNWSSYFPLTFVPSFLLSYVMSFFFLLLCHYLLPCWPLFMAKTPTNLKGRKNQSKPDLGKQHKRANSIQYDSAAYVPEDL